MKTIAIASNIRPDLGYVLINESDFNPAVHQRWPIVAPIASPVTAEPERADSEPTDIIPEPEPKPSSSRRKPRTTTEELI